MYSVDPAGRGRRLVRQPIAGSVRFGFFLLLALAVLTSTRAVFPFSPLFPGVPFFFAVRKIGSAASRRGPAAIRRPTVSPPALPSGVSKERKLLQALERHGEVTAVQAALETSLSVAEAEEMLSGLASDGHVRVGLARWHASPIAGAPSFLNR
jgi:hypothetical protein